MGAVVRVAQEAVSRLAELGIEAEWPRRALLRADAESRTVSPLAPVGFSGMVRWGRAAEYFREELVAHSWLTDDPQNVARSIHPSGQHCIVVTTGGVGTGIEQGTPTTKYAKGPGTVSCVEQNYMLDFGPEYFAQLGLPQAAAESIATWFLMFSVDQDVLYSEISLPDGISDDGVITSWRERNILGPIDLGPTTDNGDVDLGPSDPVDVPVSRR